MSFARITESISVDNYLEGELTARSKHEYVGGYVYAMVGARIPHNIIATNAVVLLGSQLKGKPCQAFNSDMKIRIQMSDHVRFYYPDAMVVCQSNPMSDAFQDQPVVIVEVLSEGTRRLDVGEKQDAYLTIPSLTHYILLEQDSPTAVVYQRIGERFERHQFAQFDDTIILPELSIVLPLRDLYDRVVTDST